MSATILEGCPLRGETWKGIGSRGSKSKNPIDVQCLQGGNQTKMVNFNLTQPRGFVKPPHFSPESMGRRAFKMNAAFQGITGSVSASNLIQ
jgi:hypothetical protein